NSNSSSTTYAPTVTDHGSDDGQLPREAC
ncbi:MAG: hypothetical protein QOG60_2638, partial [Frankiaceae bacterium]|nr:hypothetical protein [Frankiaceae bacterium]